MRIGHYYPWAAAARTGVTHSIAEWSAALTAGGHHVSVLHAGKPRPEGERFSEEVTLSRVPHFGRRPRTQVSLRLGRALEDADLLVLHEGWGLDNLVASRVAMRLEVPYVVVPHGVYEPVWMEMLKPPRGPRRALEAAVLRRALAVHVFFESESPLVRALAPGARCIVAPTGFEVPDERWQGGGDYIAWLGRYSVAHKGLDLLLDAVGELPARMRPRLRLHGSDYRGGLGQLRRRVERLGIGDSVELNGPIWGEEKSAFLRQCAGYVHPSRWECHATALLECLALGIPCLVSSQIHIAGPLRERNAALISDLEPDRLGPALTQLSEQEPELGLRGRAYVESELSWPRAVRRLFDGLSPLPGFPRAAVTSASSAPPA